MMDDLPYDIKILLDEIGVRETIILTKKEIPHIEYDVWLPSYRNEEPPF